MPKTKTRRRTGRVKRPARKDKTEPVERQLARARARAMPMDQAELAKSDLPFVVRRRTHIVPTYDYEEREHPPLEDFDWSVAACEIADAALRRGYRLLVRCPSDCIAPATAQIVHQLRGPVHVWWNAVHEVLIVGLLEDDWVEDENE